MVDKLSLIQGNLKAPKGQMNKFGGYKYRSAEDILESVKPLLLQHDLILTLSDEMVMVGERVYVKATARLTDGQAEVQTTAFAREELSKKGMDGSQVTGASSSYARKYALNGLFCIDDTKDSDATNDGSGSVPAKKKTRAEMKVIFDKSLAHINTQTNKVSAVEQTLKKYGDQFSAEQRKKLEALGSLAKVVV
tara:strand:+ start:690 stop:1268 length:579 start_codon:yes stop_codon:yes gene_type:complete